MFTHLHGHSHYSLLEALGTPGAIVSSIKGHGMTAAALTDYNGMYGAIEFYQACLKAEIKPILWVELWFVHNHLEQPKDEQTGNIVLLARNIDWYQSLLKLTSLANLNGYHEGKARIDRELLKTHAGNIIALLWWTSSYLGKLILSQESNSKIQEILWQFKDILWPDAVYLEYIAQSEKKLSDLKQVNKHILTLAEQVQLPCLVSCNFHYVNKNDAEAAEVALAIKDGKRIFDSDKRAITADWYIMSEEEIIATLQHNGLAPDTIDILINTTQQVTDSIDLKLPMWDLLFPKYDSPQHIKDLYETHKDQLISH